VTNWIISVQLNQHGIIELFLNERWILVSMFWRR